MKQAILLGVAAVALGGCNMIPGLGAPSSPQRKPGLWEQTLQADGRPTPMVTQWCFDPASDRRSPALRKPPTRQGLCEKFQTSKNGDAYVTDSVCGFGGVKLTTHSELTGDFTTHYTVVSTLDVSGSPDPARDGQHKTTLTAVYKGDCPADIGPGQVKLPDGTVEDMAALRQRGGGFGGGRGGGGGGGNETGGGNATEGGNATTNATGAGNATAGGGK
jgi:hypothetical protein